MQRNVTYIVADELDTVTFYQLKKWLSDNRITIPVPPQESKDKTCVYMGDYNLFISKKEQEEYEWD